jgi:hypothetical protein
MSLQPLAFAHRTDVIDVQVDRQRNRWRLQMTPQYDTEGTVRHRGEETTMGNVHIIEVMRL